VNFFTFYFFDSAETRYTRIALFIASNAMDRALLRKNFCAAVLKSVLMSQSCGVMWGAGRGGHRVRLASHANYRQFVMDEGLEFYPLGGDPQAPCRM